MDIHTFMTNYREAFGERAELPIAFWYSDKQESETDKIGGCFFKGLQQVREGKTTVSYTHLTLPTIYSV